MQFFILILILCLFIFLFSLYILADDDLILLRKDVSMEKVFNIAIITALISLFGARLLFAILNGSSSFFNPLVFLAFPYFPGLSLTGAVLGALIYLFFISKKEPKFPITRIFDFFAISFLATLPIGFLGYFLLAKSKYFPYDSIAIVASFSILLGVFLKFILPRFNEGKFKEGTIGLIFISWFSSISIVENFVERWGRFHFTIEDLILVVIFIVSATLLVKQEKLIMRFRFKK